MLGIGALISLILGYVSQASSEEGAEAQRRALVRSFHRANRPIDAHVIELLSGHPGEAEILDYLRHPDLESWGDVRGFLLVPIWQQLATEIDHKPTLWQALCWYAWEQRSGKWERPPWDFTNKVFPASSRTYPNTEATENAILRAFGYPLRAERIEAEAVLSDLIAPPTPRPEQIEGRYVLYFGDNGEQLFWESEPSPTAGRAFMLQPRRRGFWSVMIEDRDGNTRLLTHRPEDDPEAWVTTGGRTVNDAVRAVRRLHGLELVPSQDRHWVRLTAKRMGLEDGPHPTIDTQALISRPTEEVILDHQLATPPKPSTPKTSGVEHVSVQLLWDEAESNWMPGVLARDGEWESGLTPDTIVSNRVDEVHLDDRDLVQDDLDSFEHWVDKLGPYRFRPDTIPANWAILAVRGDVEGGDAPWYIEDGLHRLTAAKRLRLPTYPVREISD